MYERQQRNPAIAFRQTMLEDFTHNNWQKMHLYGQPIGSTLGQRIAFFTESVTGMLTRLLRDDHPPDYLIHVSCTGYDSPSATQRVVTDKGWGAHTRLLQLGHMGCYASIPALRMASHLVDSLDRSTAEFTERAPLVTICLSELCTLHLKPASTTIDQVLINTLFADGIARVDLTSDPAGSLFELVASAETIIPDSQGAMTWRPDDEAFSMFLGKEVVAALKDSLPGFVSQFLQDRGLHRSNLRCLAVHPGGPRIIQTVAQVLELDDPYVRHSKDVLRKRGNMSSVTLPCIWQSMAKDATIERGSLILSLSFGPGLTIVANLLRKQ